MNRIFYLILCTFWVVNKGDAQNLKTCVSHSHFDQKIKSDPRLESSYIKLQKNVFDYLSQNVREQDGDIIIIPTVFHIIHNGDPLGDQENISEELIMAQLQQLNDDFSRMNTDANNTPAAFQSVAANTQIQFCLAQVDESGGPTSGIVRTHIDNLPNVNETDCWTPTYIDDNIITPLIWESSSYLNIFSVIGIDELDSGNCNFFATLGYAQFPGGPSSSDAAVVSFYTVGSIQMPNPLFPNYLGRTCTHEVGHWLNLSHVWGNGNGGCGQDDGIMDTPLQFEESNGCPTFPLLDNCTPNGNGTMFMNYMDYSDDNCMNLFTAGQRAMMRASIFNVRNALLSSPCEQESVLSIPLVIEFKVENTHEGNLLSWQFDSSLEVNSFAIKKGQASNDLLVLNTVNECLSNGDVYACTYLDPVVETVSFYQIDFLLENGLVFSTDIKVVKSDFDITKINISPNPVDDKFYFSGMASDQFYRLKIFNSLGQLVKAQRGKGHEVNAVDVDHFDNGIYYILISKDRQNVLKKIVKI